MTNKIKYLMLYSIEGRRVVCFLVCSILILTHVYICMYIWALHRILSILLYMSYFHFKRFYFPMARCINSPWFLTVCCYGEYLRFHKIFLCFSDFFYVFSNFFPCPRQLGNFCSLGHFQSVLFLSQNPQFDMRALGSYNL